MGLHFRVWDEVWTNETRMGRNTNVCAVWEWITRFGTPSRLITDRGAQFRFEIFRALSTLCGIKLVPTTAYHPQSNGKVERLHRSIKAALKAHNQIDWSETLPTVLLGLRTAVQPDTPYTIAEMVYGETLRLPGEFLTDSIVKLTPGTLVHKLQEHIKSIGPRKVQHKFIPNIFVHKDLDSCTHVFLRIDRVRKPLEPPYEGPYKVINRSSKYFTIKIKEKNVTVSIDRLKPAYILTDFSNTDVTPNQNIQCQTVPSQTLSLKQQTPIGTSSVPMDPVRTSKQSSSGRPIKLPVRFRD